VPFRDARTDTSLIQHRESANTETNPVNDSWRVFYGRNEKTKRDRDSRDDSLARETFVKDDRTLDRMRNSDDFHTQRNMLFTYVHLSDAVELVRSAVEATVSGHERFWVSAPDTSVETPTRDLAREVSPDIEVRDSLGNG
jgi:hypothetical protein